MFSHQVDRSPTGSGVTARLSVQHAKGLIFLNQTRTFRNAKVNSEFTGKVCCLLAFNFRSNSAFVPKFRN